MSLWTAAEITAATKGQTTGTFVVRGVSIDSRSVAAGDLFIALHGPNHDGHDHVAAALKAGAVAAMVHRCPEGVDPAALVVVDDTFQALHALGAAGRDRFNGTVIAVTGSAGKTSTKEMLALALAPFGMVHAAVGSFNNHWGVPLTLARLPRNAAFAVVEIGMNHAGEITPLSQMTRPHAALITTIAPAHLEHFGTLDAIAEAKAEIFAGMREGSPVLLPRDVSQFELLTERAREKGLHVVSFGRHGSSACRLDDVSVEVDSTVCTIELYGHHYRYSVGVPGLHWASNSLAVLGVVEALKLDVAAAAHALAAMNAPKGRGQRHTLSLPLPAGGVGQVVLIDESYNANPASLRAALRTLACAPLGANGGRRIAVIGDMLELGDEAPALHSAQAALIDQLGIDLAYTAGPLAAHLFEALTPPHRGNQAEDSAALVPILLNALQDGDVVMVKGSAGSRMGLIVTALLETYPPSDSSER